VNQQLLYAGMLLYIAVVLIVGYMVAGRGENPSFLAPFLLFVLPLLPLSYLYFRGTKKREKELFEIFYGDRLTGLGNRRKLLKDIESTPKEQALGLVIFDVDSFGEINDLFGIHGGDGVIRQIGNFLKEFVGREGIGGKEGEYLYRLSGDEFALLFLQAPSEDELLRISAKAVLELSQRRFFVKSNDIRLTMSAGVARSSKHQELYFGANSAKNYAKKERLEVALYDERMNHKEAYKKNLFWLKKLKESILHHRIIPYYQPIVNSKTGKIEKFETLARMIDEIGAVIPPSQFLEVAKKSKLYPEITKTIIEESFKTFAKEPFLFSINLSIKDLLNQKTMDFFFDRLKHYGVASKLSVEIVESESIHDYEGARRVLEEIRQAGCNISIDDFGSGYSNFGYILKLNAKFLKIDGSLIKEIAQDEKSQSIVKAIVYFAKETGLFTVAEFVHSKEVLEKVVGLGVDYLQGYYVGEPLDGRAYFSRPKENQPLGFSSQGRALDWQALMLSSSWGIVQLEQSL